MDHRHEDRRRVPATETAARSPLVRPAWDVDGEENPKRDERLATMASRRGVLKLGVAGLLGGAGALGAREASAGRGSFLAGWRYCSKCQGMFYDGGPTGAGHCPAGTSAFPAHAATGDYSLRYGARVKGEQRNWWCCVKCAGLWFAGTGGVGTCPGGDGGHAQIFSSNFSLRVGGPTRAGYEANWRYCHKCLGLWSLAGPGVCPADHRSHSQHLSGNYSVRVT